MGFKSFSTLDPTTIIRGFFTLAFIIVGMIIGIKLILKYFKYKDKTLLTAGLTWIFLSSSWWGFNFSFLFILMFNYQLESSVYIFLVNFFLPISIIFWSYTWTMIYNKEKFKQAFYTLLTICLIFQIIFIVAFFIDPNYIQIHIPNDPNAPDGFTYRRTIISYFISIGLLIIFVVTGILLGYRILQSKDPNIYWKGRFLILAVLISIFGVIIDIFAASNIIFQVFARLLMIISTLFFYFSFFLPEKLAEKLIKG